MIFSTYFTGTRLKENFFLKVMFALGFFWNFIMIAVSWTFSKSLLFEGHSKVFNISTVSAKYSLKVLAISSLFTNKVFRFGNFIWIVSNLSFLIRITMNILVGKVGLTLISKSFWVFGYLCNIKITKFWISNELSYQILLSLIFHNIIFLSSAICFVFKLRALHNGFTKSIFKYFCSVLDNHLVCFLGSCKNLYH